MQTFGAEMTGNQRTLPRTRLLQHDALRAAGVDDAVNLYRDDFASGVRDDRPGLDSCLRALRKDDVLVVWKLDRLGGWKLGHLAVASGRSGGASEIPPRREEDNGPYMDPR